MYRIVYIIMLASFSYLSLQAQDIKTKLVGVCLTVANALIFWKG